MRTAYPSHWAPGGAQVANEILAWRATDGLNPPAPPYLGSNDPGKWRPPPPGFLPGLAPRSSYAPWVIPSPASFALPDPRGPDQRGVTQPVFNEEKAVANSRASSARADQHARPAIFWGSTAPYVLENRAAASAAVQLNNQFIRKRQGCLHS